MKMLRATMGFMAYFSRPKVFAISIAVILFLGLVTWFADSYLTQLIELQAESNLKEAHSTAARVLSRDKLLVGVRYDLQPFGFINTEGQIDGFDIELAREFAKRWLGDASDVEFIKVTSSDRIPRLAAGEVDLIMASMAHKRERDALIDFSQIYFVDGQSLLVQEDSSIHQLEDLHNKTIAAIQGSSTIEIIQNVAGQRRVDIAIRAYPGYNQALDALTNGAVDALTADGVTLTQFAQDNPGLQVIGERFTQEPYGIGVPQDDSYLREMLNFTLQDMKQDGTYDQIYQRWFPTDEPYNIEISPGEWPHTLATLPNIPIEEKISRIQDILERGKIIVSVQANMAPFGIQKSNGQFEGFDIDIVREFARRWLGDTDAVQFVSSSTEESGVLANHIERLVLGEVDLIAAALVQRREWAETIDYSQTYLGTPLVVEPLSIGLPQNDSLFRELVNVTLQEMKLDGTYDAFFAKWFGTGIPEYDIGIVPGDADYLLLPYRDQELAPRITSAQESTIKHIYENDKVLRIGIQTNLAPFSTLNDNEQLEGFDIDLVQAMAETWGVSITFAPVTPSERLQKLTSGEINMIASALPHTKDLESDLDFSQTYFVSGQSLLVLRNNGINTVNDLDGLTVAALRDTASIDHVLAHAESNGVSINIAAFADFSQSIEALKHGEVAAITADNVTLSQLAKNDSDLVEVGGLFTQTPYGFGLASGDSYFNNLVNFTLQTLKQEGVYDKLYRKWFGKEAIPYPLEILPGTWPYTFELSPTTLDKPVRSKVDDILIRRKFSAGVKFDFKPFGYLDTNGDLIGFDVDLMREFAARWLGDAEAVEFVQVTSANRIQKLVASEIDIIAASMSHKRERDELIDFSQTYYLDGQSLLVRSNSGINGLENLDNRLVAAIQGSAAIENIQAVANQQGVGIDILPFQEYPQALEALKAGQVDALTTVKAALSQFALDNNDLNIIGDRFTTEPYGLGLPNHDDRFQDLVNFTLQEMKLDGTYDRLYAKWFGDDHPYPIEIWPGETYLDIDMIPMRRIPAGEFVRGNANGFPDEKMEEVIALEEFYIDQYEVTNHQYAKCVQAGRCTLPRLPRSVNFSQYYAESDFRNFPVIWVNWSDAANYCNFVGKRLPTEAEWEKAARGPGNHLYPWGNQEPTNQANFDYAQRDVTPVGSYPTDISGYGVYDMAGNVREWVADWYLWNFYQIAPKQNPSGPETGVTKVLRGGSWNDTALYLRTTVRKNFLPESFDSNLGFRCASSTFPAAR